MSTCLLLAAGKESPADHMTRGEGCAHLTKAQQGGFGRAAQSGVDCEFPNSHPERATRERRRQDRAAASRRDKACTRSHDALPALGVAGGGDDRAAATGSASGFQRISRAATSAICRRSASRRDCRNRAACSSDSGCRRTAARRREGRRSDPCASGHARSVRPTARALICSSTLRRRPINKSLDRDISGRLGLGLAVRRGFDCGANLAQCLNSRVGDAVVDELREP